jgi:hypothetical protein
MNMGYVLLLVWIVILAAIIGGEHIVGAWGDGRGGEGTRILIRGFGRGIGIASRPKLQILVMRMHPPSVRKIERSVFLVAFVIHHHVIIVVLIFIERAGVRGRRC